MNIDHIEAFLYTVHLKSAQKAAKALFLSQPTITARIKSLERELGTELFFREGKYLTLSTQGKQFIPYAQTILDTLKAGKNKLHQQNVAKEIIIGSNMITAQYFIPYVIREIHHLELPYRLKFLTSTTKDLVNKLQTEEIDIAFIRDIDQPAIFQEKIVNNPIHLVVYPNHPFVGLEDVNISMLSDESLVFFECGAFDWKLIYKMFEVEQMAPNIKYDVSHLNVAKEIIKSGSAIGFLPEACIKEELASGQLIIVNTNHLQQMNQDVYMSYKHPEKTKFLHSAIQKAS